VVPAVEKKTDWKKLIPIKTRRSAGKKLEMIRLLVESKNIQTAVRDPSKQAKLGVVPIKNVVQPVKTKVIVEQGTGQQGKKRKWTEVWCGEKELMIKFCYESATGCVTKIKNVAYPNAGDPLIIEEDV
jgi:hypothetical protein